MVDSHRHSHGLGGYPRVSLKKARRRADKVKRRLLKGKPAFPVKDPVPVVPTLHEASCAACEKRRGSLDQDPEARAWTASIERHVPQEFRTKPVSEITSGDIVAILDPIWDSMRPTASRVRSFLRQTMAWAIVQGYRSDNPAGDVLQGALKRGGHIVKHRLAHEHPFVAAAVAKVQAHPCAPEIRLLYELLALTALRTGELRALRWDEIDWHLSVVCIPLQRMKRRHEFVVPMSSRVTHLLQHARDSFRTSDYVFPGRYPHAPLSRPALPHALKRIQLGAVAHGLRASFRTWAAEQGVRDAVAEACLAHGPKGMVGKAYIRTTFFEERREVMEHLAQYLLATDPTAAERTTGADFADLDDETPCPPAHSPSDVNASGRGDEVR